MGDLADILNAVHDLIAGLQSGGEYVFAGSRVHQAADRKAAVAAITRELKPAAFILYDGRTRTDHDDGSGGAFAVSLLIAVENLRGDPAALTGDAQETGALAALALVSAALDGAVVEAEYRLLAIDERFIAGDERSVVFEQRYRVERLAGASAPTFDGEGIAGSDAVMTVLVGPLSVDAVAFGFPGIDGVHRHLTGVKGRTITWKGQLRADTDAALSAIESDLERRVALGVVATVVDPWGREFDECVLDSFERVGPRRHAMTGQVVQGFELVFTQLR